MADLRLERTSLEQMTQERLDSLPEGHRARATLEELLRQIKEGKEKS